MKLHSYTSEEIIAYTEDEELSMTGQHTVQASSQHTYTFNKANNITTHHSLSVVNFIPGKHERFNKENV